MVKIKHYENGAEAHIQDGNYIYIKYNTGDEVWFEYMYNLRKVELVRTFDGLWMVPERSGVFHSLAELE